MRIRINFPFFVALLSVIQLTTAALFGGDSSSSAAAPNPSSSDSGDKQSGNSTAVEVSPEVALLLTLQEAKISSMSCLIAFVNMTTSPIGKCLGLNEFIQLVTNTDPAGTSLSQVQPPPSFADSLSSYLNTVCESQCGEKDIQEAQNVLAERCSSDGVKDSNLVRVLGGLLSGYASSYRTLACMVHYNGTSDLCLPATLNSSSTANTYTFFNDLVAGRDLSQYTDSVWKVAECSGCMYEMFKSAQYTTPSIRGSEITKSLGDHLEKECPGQNALPINWPDVQDQQIPDSLELGQNQNPGGSGKGTTGGGMRRISSLGIVGQLARTFMGMGRNLAQYVRIS